MESGQFVRLWKQVIAALEEALSIERNGKKQSLQFAVSFFKGFERFLSGELERDLQPSPPTLE